MPGIGRRTFCTRIGADILSLRKSIIISFEEGDNIRDIAVKLAEEAGAYQSHDSLLQLTKLLETAPINEVNSRISNYLRTISRENFLLIFYDEGGIVDDSAFMTDAASALCQLVHLELDSYLALISRRRMKSYPEQIPCIRVSPLPPDDVKQLIVAAASTRYSLAFDVHQLNN